MTGRAVVLLLLLWPAFAEAQDCQGHVCKVTVTLTRVQIAAMPTTSVEDRGEV